MMYKSIDIWKRVNEKTLARYRCFQILSSGQYCVQSVDYYHLPIDDTQALQLDNQFLELLSEEAPEARAETYATLEEAIRMHDQEFEN